MPTSYIYRLHVIVSSQQLAAALSASVYSQFPEVGPNNVGTELVPAGGNDDATATAWEFNAPVVQEYIDYLAAMVATLPSNQQAAITWVRTDRNDVLQKRWDDENPTPVVMTADAFRAERGVKLRRVSVYA